MDTMELANVNTELAYTASNYSTININDSETRKMVANAVNNAQSLSTIGSSPFTAVGVMTKPGVRRSRDKNVPDAPCTDTVIVCADGSAYFTKSEGIRRAIDNLVGMRMFDDGEPVTMRVVESKMSNGNTLKTIELV